MVQQFYYKKFSSMKKHVDCFLSENNRFRIIRKETDGQADSVVYSIRFRWSLINLVLLHKTIRMKLVKVDETITRMEVGFVNEQKRNFKSLRFKFTYRQLENLTYVF